MLQYCNKLLYEKINSKVNDASPFQNLWNSNWQLLCIKLIIILQSSLWEMYINISDIYNKSFQKSSDIYFNLPTIKNVYILFHRWIQQQRKWADI